MTNAAPPRPTSPSFREKFIVEVRGVSASTKRASYRWALTLAIVGVVGFVSLLTIVVTQGEVAAMDEPFLEWLLGTHSEVLTAVMIWLAIIFGPVAVPIAVIIVAIGWSIRSKHIWRPLLFTMGMTAGLLVVQVVTRVVGRERPPLDQMLFGADLTPSFPSGHVAGAADFMLLIAYLVFSRRARPKTAALSFTIAGVLIIVAGVSRIYLGYHWPSDALASVFLSLTVLGGVIGLDTYRTMRVKP